MTVIEWEEWERIKKINEENDKARIERGKLLPKAWEDY